MIYPAVVFGIFSLLQFTITQSAFTFLAEQGDQWEEYPCSDPGSRARATTLQFGHTFVGPTRCECVLYSELWNNETTLELKYPNEEFLWQYAYPKWRDAEEGVLRITILVQTYSPTLIIHFGTHGTHIWYQKDIQVTMVTGEEFEFQCSSDPDIVFVPQSDGTTEIIQDDYTTTSTYPSHHIKNETETGTITTPFMTTLSPLNEEVKNSKTSSNVALTAGATVAGVVVCVTLLVVGILLGRRCTRNDDVTTGTKDSSGNVTNGNTVLRNGINNRTYIEDRKPTSIVSNDANYDVIPHDKMDKTNDVRYENIEYTYLNRHNVLPETSRIGPQPGTEKQPYTTLGARLENQPYTQLGADSENHEYLEIEDGTYTVPAPSTHNHRLQRYQ